MTIISHSPPCASAPLSPREMQAIGGAYMILGLFARCEELRRVDRANEAPTPN